MREFMDYIQSAFYSATSWNSDNSYSSLNATADALLNFSTPRGLRLTLGSLATPQFATAYQLGTIGVVDGSISYLYSTVSLSNAIAQSERIPLPDLLRSYKPLAELPRGIGSNDGIFKGWQSQKREVLAYGRLYLPKSILESLVVKRLTPALQMQVSAVSDENMRNGGTVLGMLQADKGRYGVEGLFSTDGGLLGVRGLYNFGGDVEHLDASADISHNGSHGNGNNERERIYGRFSAGAELYYGTLNKSGGMSLGARFATLPTYKGTPLTATMTINPLMGNISWTYAVMAGKQCSFATRMDFNVFSYESDWAVGMELWRKKRTPVVAAINEDVASSMPMPSQAPTSRSDELQRLPSPPQLPKKRERSFQAKMEWRLDEPVEPVAESTGSEVLPLQESVPVAVVEPELATAAKERSFEARLAWRLDDPKIKQAIAVQNKPVESTDEEYSGVLKARLDQNLRIGLLWEGRVKSLLFSLGSGVDLHKLDAPFRSLGLEVQFSS